MKLRWHVQKRGGGGGGGVDRGHYTVVDFLTQNRDGIETNPSRVSAPTPIVKPPDTTRFEPSQARAIDRCCHIGESRDQCEG